MKSKMRFLALSMLLLGSFAAIEAAERATIGSQVSSFALKDIHGGDWSLESVSNKPVVVLAFLGTECPLVQTYAGRLSELAAEYEERGVAFIGIDSNQQDAPSEIAHFIKINGIRFPMLKDVGNVVADLVGAQRTPEVLVLDAERRVRYRGRIDDQYSYGVQRPKPNHRFLVNALDELLSGKPVTTPEIEPIGCHIGRVLTPAPDSDVTYSNQISRILNKRCVECHRPGELAPFSMTSYSDTVGWAEMIAEVVREQRMPPWHSDSPHGTFINDSRLLDEEKEQIFAWVRAGAPEGNPADLPDPPQFETDWRIGKPDLVVYMSEKPFQVPAEGEVKYQYFTVDPGFTEDKWIKAAECRPGNRAVVHHIIVAAGDRERLARGLQDDISSDWLAATAPGARPMMLPAGLAKRIPAGSRLVFQMHYTPNGKAQEDRSCIALKFADPSEIKHEVFTQKAANPRFQIPPGEPSHKVEADYKFKQDSLMLAMFPHMHLRGKSFSYTAIYPDGREEMLLNVPRYDFNWQNAYAFGSPKRMPAGTCIHCVAHFDNSSDNLANPDPTATVRWGDQTWEEMMIGYFDIMPEAEIKVTPQKLVTRTATFLEKASQGKLESRDAVKQAAMKAFESSESWQALLTEMRTDVPQLDRLCWITLDSGKLNIERAAQQIRIRRFAEAGMSFPAIGLKLAEHITAGQPVMHDDLTKLADTADFQLIGRVYSSSYHVPLEIQGKKGIVSFWSIESKAFPNEATSYLDGVVAEMKAIASE